MRYYKLYLVLNDKGEYLHTQNSALLEKDKSYDIRKVEEFLKHWTVKAISPESYR